MSGSTTARREVSEWLKVCWPHDESVYLVQPFRPPSSVRTIAVASSPLVFSHVCALKSAPAGRCTAVVKNGCSQVARKSAVSGVGGTALLVA